MLRGEMLFAHFFKILFVIKNRAIPRPLPTKPELGVQK
jgi:hypothetical protein